MASHNELGRQGEQMALDYLIANDYEVLETNYRYRKAEIDIIVRKDGVLIFVEVKTRSGLAYGPPESFVSEKKMELFMEAGYKFMDKINHDWEIRFDVISLLMGKNRLPQLKHLEDAFVP
ncbi:YraN family protein [Portibacter lacus]|uniref:UPF0102 protein GCM10007940_37500 n=1 Tax=Portibacter lacus TaxID=1099794 RepID=A0AA37SST5_9BACT|nr:YraN family protein [Portibacter lacus]GLR19134.1 UPF0102 protein [Portibacter lacus]